MDLPWAWVLVAQDRRAAWRTRSVHARPSPCMPPLHLPQLEAPVAPGPAAELNWEAVAQNLAGKSPLEIMDHVRGSWALQPGALGGRAALPGPGPGLEGALSSTQARACDPAVPPRHAGAGDLWRRDRDRLVRSRGRGAHRVRAPHRPALPRLQVRACWNGPAWAGAGRRAGSERRLWAMELHPRSSQCFRGAPNPSSLSKLAPSPPAAAWTRGGSTPRRTVCLRRWRSTTASRLSTPSPKPRWAGGGGGDWGWGGAAGGGLR